MFHRMRLAVVGAALVATTPLVAVTATADVATTAAPAKPERTITLKGVEPREGVFFAKGRVTPDYKNRFAIMQRKLKSADRWRDWDKFKTTSQSRYRERIAPLKRTGVVCYRVKIKGNANFKTSYSHDVVCIRTFVS